MIAKLLAQVVESERKYAAKIVEVSNMQQQMVQMETSMTT